MHRRVVPADKELRKIGMRGQGPYVFEKTLLKKKSSNEKMILSLRKEEQ
jgi:hypothetical protein